MKFKTHRIMLCMCVMCACLYCRYTVGPTCWWIWDSWLYPLSVESTKGIWVWLVCVCMCVCVCVCVCVCDHVLFYSYTNMFNIPEPCDVIDEVLTYVAKRLHALEKGGQRYTEFIFSNFLLLYICIRGHTGLFESCQTFFEDIQRGTVGKSYHWYCCAIKNWKIVNIKYSASSIIPTPWRLCRGVQIHVGVYNVNSSG